MEMMFLIVKLGYGSTVIPEKYSNTQCIAIAETINKTYSKEAICIPAAMKLMCKVGVTRGAEFAIDVPCDASILK